MRATHRVIDEDKQAVGFLVDGSFYTDATLRERFQYVENIGQKEDGSLFSKEALEKLSYEKAVNQAFHERICSQNPFEREKA